MFSSGSNYVHVDVSDDFSAFGKWSVAIIYLFVLGLLRSSCFKSHRAVISFVGAMIMVVWRLLMTWQGYGPTFDVRRGIVVEPLLFLFGSLVIAQSFGKHVFEKRLKSNSQNELCLMTMMCAIIITAVLGDYSAVLLLSGVCVTDALKLALLSGTTLGATLSLTGGLSNILAVTVAYDDIFYFGFVRDKCLPFLAALLIYVFALLIVARASNVTETTTQDADYSGVSADDNCTDQKDKQSENDIVVLDGNVEAFEIDHTISVHQEFEPFSLWFVLVYFILIVVFYLAGLDVIMICLFAASALLAFFSWRSQQLGGESLPSPLSKLDYGILINVTGQLLLTASLNDTGLPQAFWNLSMGPCADRMTSSSCVYRFAAVHSLLCIMVSSMNANFMTAATFPYASPYDWMQVTLVSSLIGNLTWSPFNRPQLSSWTNYWTFAIPTAMLSICVGVFILDMVHFSLECSERLGECPIA